MLIVQCLSSVSIAAGAAFAPYTLPVYQRCANIIQNTLQAYQAADADPENVEEPDRTFIVVSLDLLSGLTQGLGEHIAQLVSTIEPSLVHLMAVCLTVSRFFRIVQCSPDKCSTSSRPSGNLHTRCSATWPFHALTRSSPRSRKSCPR